VLHNVGHARLVADEGSQVARLRLVILREMSDTTSVLLCASLGKESERSVSGALKLSV
jgi:hypothetical protein